MTDEEKAKLEQALKKKTRFSGKVDSKLSVGLLEATMNTYYAFIASVLSKVVRGFKNQEGKDE